MGKKVGIMGGTFNPIHIGHMLIAENAYETFGLDEILFVPTGNSYMKENVLDKKTRITMTGISIEDNPHFALSTLEVEREGKSYSYETIETLKQKYPENTYYFIVGADSFVSMDTWKHPERIFAGCTVLVASRIGIDDSAIDEKIAEYAFKYGASVNKLPIRCVDISSSELRQRAKEGRSLRYQVHYRVNDYILKNNLYKD